MDKLFKTEKSQRFFEEILRPVLVLTVICLAVAVLLSLTNLLTEKRIEQLAIDTQNKAMQTLIPEAEFTKVSFSADGESTENVTLYEAIKNGEKVGFIAQNKANGYGGEISVMVAISPEVKIMGVEILSAADETPGLGQNITKPEFYNQFMGKGINISVLKNGAVPEKNEINAVTGATISSKATTNAVNGCIIAAEAYIKAEGGAAQ